MRRVAAEEDAPVAEAIRDEAATEPILLADDLVAEIRADAEDGADRPIAVNRVEVRLIVLEVIVDQPRLAPVDGVDGAAATRVERDVPPRGRPAHERQQLWRADVTGLHALHDGIAHQPRANRAAHLGSSAIAPDEVARGEGQFFARVEMAGPRRHTIVVLREIREAGPIQDRDAGRRRGMVEKDRFEKDLVDPMRRLRGRPPCIRATRGGVAVAAAGDRDARQLPPDHRRAIGDVVRIVRRQPGVPELAARRRAAGTTPSSGRRHDCT